MCVAWVCVRVSLCARTHMHALTRVRPCACASVCASVCTYACARAHARASERACVRARTHLPASRNRRGGDAAPTAAPAPAPAAPTSSKRRRMPGVSSAAIAARTAPAARRAASSCSRSTSLSSMRARLCACVFACASVRTARAHARVCCRRRAHAPPPRHAEWTRAADAMWRGEGSTSERSGGGGGEVRRSRWCCRKGRCGRLQHPPAPHARPHQKASRYSTSKCIKLFRVKRHCIASRQKVGLRFG